MSKVKILGRHILHNLSYKSSRKTLIKASSSKRKCHFRHTSKQQFQTYNLWNRFKFKRAKESMRLQDKWVFWTIIIIKKPAENMNTSWNRQNGEIVKKRRYDKFILYKMHFNISKTKRHPAYILWPLWFKIC